MNYVFAERANLMQSSAIREILKVTETPEVISFAGGLPAPELFPMQEIKSVVETLFAAGDGSLLQYSTTEGDLQLREYIVSVMKEKGVKADTDEILITSGSQQALDLLGKLFLDKDDVVVVENPTYLGALQAFSAYRCRYASVPTDEEGIRIDELERVFRSSQPKLVYLTPTFKNPTGETMSLKRRRELAELLAGFRVPVIEDDPYGELRYAGNPVPPVKALDRSQRVIYLNTFSKTIAPGLRLGWVVAEHDLIQKLVQAKQAADLHSGTLVQRIVYGYVTGSDVKKHIEVIRREYGQRRDAMIEALHRYFPPGSTWTEPEGGMFLWVTLPEGLNAAELLDDAVQAKVAYVPGSPFFAAGGGENCMRLNFSNSHPQQIEEGIKRLGELFSSRQ